MPPSLSSISRLVRDRRLVQASELVADHLLTIRGKGLRPLLSEVVKGGGLGWLALAIEHRYGGVSVGDYRTARAKLSELERGIGRIRGDAEIPLDRFPMSEGAYRQGRIGPGRRKILSKIDQIADRLRPFRDPFSAVQPGLVTDSLLRRPGVVPGPGSCFPDHCLMAHLAHRAKIPFGVLLYSRHVNLYSPGLDRVVNLGSEVHLSLLSEWREVGLLGQGQGVAPLAAIVSGSLLALAQRLAIDQNPEGAMTYYRAALRVYPDLSTAHGSLGTLEPSQKAASAYFKAARKINPRDSGVYLTQGIRFRREGMRDLALESFQRALDIDKENFRKMIRLFGEPLAVSFSLPLARRWLTEEWIAEIYFSKGEYGKAAELTERLLHRVPDDYSRKGLLYLQWGINLLNLGRVEEALALFLTGYERDPNLLPELRQIRREVDVAGAPAIAARIEEIMMKGYLYHLALRL